MIGELPATIFSPLNDENVVHPVVVFAHGFAAWKDLYTWIPASLVNRGIVTLLFTVPNTLLPEPRQWSDGIKSALDYLLGETHNFSTTVSSERIGAMGHSMGGLGAIRAAHEDSRITCVVGLAPAILPHLFPLPQEIYELPLPIQLQIGTKDGLISLKNVHAFYSKLHTSKKQLITINGGNHLRFVDAITVTKIVEYMTALKSLINFRDDSAQISFGEQHSVSRNNFLEWFRSYL